MKVIQIEHEDIPYWKMTYTPALSHCRRLMNAGVDPETRLEILRNGRVDYVIRTIREGAALSVKDDPNIHFSKYEERFKDIRGDKAFKTPTEAPAASSVIDLNEKDDGR